ncbi:MAG: acyl-CoA dehydratase activase [Candidatus Helarchaeota archaeon]|nr:acyl-CoA dehydratase activase [Candidatus Helarchaeota archaeon]
MAFAGVDIGAVSAKAVIISDKKLLGYSILPTGSDVVKVAERVLNECLNKAGLLEEDLVHIVATGYGRIAVPFANEKVTEISCHAKGANWLLPETKMVIDIGGQDSKAIRISETGTVISFAMNDKCAAGTGRFLEVMAHALELPIEEFGRLSLRSINPCSISSICTVFAESEVISLRAEKKPVQDIIAGIHKSVAKRIVAMTTPIGIALPITMTGGVAKNVGQRKALEEELGIKLLIPEEPQIVGALGAALFAQKGQRK